MGETAQKMSILCFFSGFCARWKVVTISMGEILEISLLFNGGNQQQKGTIEILQIVRFGIVWQNRETHYLWGRYDRYANN